jgi:hypothetical protein
MVNGWIFAHIIVAGGADRAVPPWETGRRCYVSLQADNSACDDDDGATRRRGDRDEESCTQGGSVFVLERAPF